MRLSLSKCVTMFAMMFSLVAGSQGQWKVSKTFPIGGDGSWDYLTVDSATHRLFVPRSTHTMVIDGRTGKVLGDIPGQKIAHGVALVPKLSRGFISDGGGAVVVFDLKTYRTLGTLTSEQDSDGIIYDPVSGLILMVSGDGGSLMTFRPDIDPVYGKIGPSIALGGAPEFLAADNAGMVYINLEDKDNVAVVELATQKVIAHWPVGPGGAPVGMSLDEKEHLLVIGGRNPQKMVLMSTQGGKVVGSIPIGPSVDATKIDSGDMLASCGDSTLAVVRETSPGKFETMQTVATGPGARTMGVDTSTHTIYMPTADFLPQELGSNRRPQPKPGTFKLLVVTKQ